jgi:uncharacterized protein YpbB
MTGDTDDLLLFRLCRNLRGDIHNFDLIRRNGQLVPNFRPEWTSLVPEADREAEDAWRKELRDELCTGLNALERRTWERIIDGIPILDIAAMDGVSRSAIYERIRGIGTGGMVAKNPYVALWWALRLRRQLAEKIARRKSASNPKDETQP